MKERKNLEAQNEIYKGLFRIPFAVVMGGPIVALVNIFYTAFKANEEINRENKHRKYIESQFVRTPTQTEWIQRQNEKDQLVKDNHKRIISYLRNEFKGSYDPTVSESVYVSYNTKELPRKNNTYNALFYMNSIDRIKGLYYPEEEFVTLYKNDKKSGTIIDKYIFSNKDVMALFGYSVKSKLPGVDKEIIFTGMFESIQKG